MEKKQEEFKVSGDELIKNEEGKEIIQVPLTIGAVGALLAPPLAAVGAVAALLTKCTIVVVKR